MLKKKDRYHSFFRYLFLVAAVYDFVLGALFLLFYRSIFQALGITVPVYTEYLQMSAAFVIAMGFGYYFVFKNMSRNIDLVKLGVIYKFVYSAVVSYFYFGGRGHVTFFYFAICDLIFMILFIWFLYWAKDKKV